jgi:DNA-binding NtrC family response regulator
VSGCYPDLLKGAPPGGRPGPGPLEELPMREATAAFRRELLLSRLERHDWDLKAVREGLRLPKTTLRRYMAKLGVRPPAHARTDED